MARYDRKYGLSCAATLPILLVGLLVFASAAATQPAPNVARIGMLCSPKCDTVYNTVFFDELRKLGWVEGTNLAVERKDPDNRLDQLPAFAADLVQSKPDLIVAVAAQAASEARAAVRARVAGCRSTAPRGGRPG